MVPDRLLKVDRRILDDQLSRTGRARKVSFTHLIGYAVVEALPATPVMDSTSCHPTAPIPRRLHASFTAATWARRRGGHREAGRKPLALVPVIEGAERANFRRFWSAYEDLVRKVQTNRVGADDLNGANVSLGNTGTWHRPVRAPAHARQGVIMASAPLTMRRMAGRRPQGAGRG